MKKENFWHDTDHIHDLSMYNWKYKLTSKKCWCFYCLKVYDTSVLTEDNKLCGLEDTYFCKYCWVDSLIFDSSYKFNENLLKKMKKQRFNWI